MQPQILPSSGLNVIPEKHRVAATNLNDSVNIMTSSAMKGRQKSLSAHKSFSHGNESSFRSYDHSNPLNKSEIDGRFMRNKKENVRATKQNLEVLRNRIECLKRNVSTKEKQEQAAIQKI